MRPLLTIVALAIWAAPAASEPVVVRHPATGDPAGRNEYQVAVLRAVLESTVETHGPYRLQPVAEMPQAREILSLSEGLFHDVLWTVTSAEREHVMRPIRFPLLRGLLGHRVCLVRAADPPFRPGATPSREGLVIGQAITWPDTPIFQANGFVLEAGSDYQSTRRMLLAGRTNCFPRGLSEIDIELAAYGTSELAVDPEASFLYFAPMYFFVAPENAELASRIEAGLERIRASGELDAIYARFFDVEDLWERYRMADRNPFCLTNPDLPADLVREMEPLMISRPGSFADACLRPPR